MCYALLKQQGFPFSGVFLSEVFKQNQSGIFFGARSPKLYFFFLEVTVAGASSVVADSHGAEE